MHRDRLRDPDCIGTGCATQGEDDDCDFFVASSLVISINPHPEPPLHHRRGSHWLAILRTVSPNRTGRARNTPVIVPGEVGGLRQVLAVPPGRRGENEAIFGGGIRVNGVKEAANGFVWRVQFFCRRGNSDEATKRRRNAGNSDEATEGRGKEGTATKRSRLHRDRLRDEGNGRSEGWFGERR